MRPFVGCLIYARSRGMFGRFLGFGAMKMSAGDASKQYLSSPQEVAEQIRRREIRQKRKEIVMKRLLILPVLALIGAAAFCTGMFSSETEDTAIDSLPDYSSSAVTVGVSDEYLYNDTRTPAVSTPAPDASGAPVTDSAPTTPGVTEFTRNEYLSGTVVIPDTEDAPVTEVTTESVVTKPVTTTKPVITTKPVTTKPVTTPQLPETTDAPLLPTPDDEVKGQASTIVEIAKGEIGVQEKKYNNVKYNTWYFGYEVRDRYSGGTSYAWCAVFLGWCADQAGIDTDTIPLVRGTVAMQRFYENLGRYTKYSASYTPKVGDIIFFDWSGGRGGVDHVGIVVAVKDGMITTVEGNYSDQVSCNTYAINHKYITGYATPDYQS